MINSLISSLTIRLSTTIQMSIRSVFRKSSMFTLQGVACQGSSCLT